MCLALPARVVTMDGNGMATVSLGGITKEISMILVENVEAGDFVLVHAGYALARISQEEARRTLSLMAEAGLTESGAL